MTGASDPDSRGDNDDPRPDDELIDAINRGDEAAFDALYHRHRDWVVRLAARFTADRDDALDVLQETFLYLLRKTPRLHLTARMTTFLYPVVKHLALSRRRKRDREITYDGPPDRAAADPPAQRSAGPATDGIDLRAELAAVMQALPDAQREVVLMRFVDDLSLAEIAEALDVPLGTVKSRLHHAIAALRADRRTRAYFG